MLLTTKQTSSTASTQPSSIRANDKDGLLSSVLVFQTSTNVKGKNKYWQFCIISQSDDDNSSDDESCASINLIYYLQSRHGITTKDSRTGKTNTSGGSCYQKAFQSELQAQKELLSRIHSKLSDGYVWIYNRKKRKFPLDELVKQVNDKLQEQYNTFKNMFSNTTTSTSTTSTSVLPRVASPQRFTNMVVRRMGLSPSRNIPHLKTRIDRRKRRQMDKSFSREQLLKLSELSTSDEEDENEDVDQRVRKTIKNRQQKRKYKSSSSSSEECSNVRSEDDTTPRVSIRTKQVKKKRKPEISIPSNTSTSVAPTRSFGNMNDGSDSDSDFERDEGFSGFERISTPERFRSFDKVNSPGMVSEMDSDHENRSFNNLTVMNQDDDDSFLLGGGGADFMDQPSFSYSTTTPISTEMEEKIKKLTESLAKESERANLLSLEKSYIENQLKEQQELNILQKLSHDKLVDELSQQLQQISKDKLENTKEFLEREEQFKAKEEELYNREHEISSRQYLLKDKESKLTLEKNELERKFEELFVQKSNLEKYEKELNERMQQLIQSEKDLTNQIEQHHSIREQETNRLNQMEQDFNERMQKLEQEIQNKWSEFETANNNFEIDIKRRNQELEQVRLRIESDLENAKQLFEQEKKFHQHEIETRQGQLNSLDESINEKLVDLEMKQHAFIKEKESFHIIMEQREKALSEKQAEQELQGQHLASFKSQLEEREKTFEESYTQFNERLAESERLLKLKSDNLLSQLDSISERERTLEREKSQFFEIAKKRSAILSQSKLLAQQLNEKQAEFQLALSEWMVSTSQDDLFSIMDATDNDETSTIISSAPIPSYLPNDEIDTDNSQSQFF